MPGQQGQGQYPPGMPMGQYYKVCYATLFIRPFSTPAFAVQDWNRQNITYIYRSCFYVLCSRSPLTVRAPTSLEVDTHTAKATGYVCAKSDPVTHVKWVRQMFSLLHFPASNSPPGLATTPTPRCLATPHPLWPQEVVFLHTCRQTRMWSPRFHPTWNQIWQPYRPLQVSVHAALKHLVPAKHWIIPISWIVWFNQR